MISPCREGLSVALPCNLSITPWVFTQMFSPTISALWPIITAMYQPAWMTSLIVDQQEYLSLYLGQSWLVDLCLKVRSLAFFSHVGMRFLTLNNRVSLSQSWAMMEGGPLFCIEHCKDGLEVAASGSSESQDVSFTNVFAIILEAGDWSSRGPYPGQSTGHQQASWGCLLIPSLFAVSGILVFG